jgi:hypothetical protein
MGSGVLERGFEQPDSNTESNTCASQGTLIIRHGPRVTLQLLKHIRDLELGLLNR